MDASKVFYGFLIGFCLIVSSAAVDVTVQVNLKRLVNVVSDKYVSFSIDPKVLLENINTTDSAMSDFMAKQLKPSYLKISGNSFFKLLSALSNGEQTEELQNHIPETVWTNFNQWIHSVDWTPIIPLPYNPKKWDSIHALRILNISSSLGIKDCIWQLGIDFDPTDAPRYVDDLTTLKNIVDAFDGPAVNWSVVGADISAGSNRDETRLYIELAHDVVEAIGWLQPSEYTTYEHQNNVIYDQDVALRTILSRNLPAWLTVPPKMTKNGKHNENCTDLCITEGLLWAQMLGDAAQKGFSVVFKPLEKSDIVEPGFSFYISWLYKKTMGEKVFDTKILSGDRYISHFYSHCTKDLSGAVTVMGINMGEMSARISAKLSYRYTGPELWQYILTINDGIVRLNGEVVRLNMTYEPVVKIKHPSKPLSLILPPLSIGFWILPSANIKECYKEDVLEYSGAIYSSEAGLNERLMTSSDRLLQELIRQTRGSPNAPASNRQKRHIVVKKDSNYLNQLIRDVDQKDILNFGKSSELVRTKRFILKNKNHNRFRAFPNLFQLGAFDGFGGFGGASSSNAAPPTPPPPPPPPKQQPVDSLDDENRRFKRVFPRLPFLKLEELFNPKFRRVRRQIPNLFKFGRDRPRLFPGMRRMMSPNAPGQEDRPMNEELLLAPRKDVYFPEGDVLVNITRIPDADYDYVEFDGGDAQKQKKKFNAPDNAAFRRIPNTFHETYTITDVVPRVDKPFVPPALSAKSSQSKNLGLVTHELEPTVNLNNLQLQKAQEQLDSYYMPAETKLSSNEKKHSSDEEFTPKFREPVATRKRKRRNAVLKSLSWALKNGDNQLSNIIRRENSGDDPGNNYNRIVPFLRLEDYDRSAKPRSLEELQNASVNEEGMLELDPPASNAEIDEQGPDVAKIRIIAEGPASNPQVPKFMQYLTHKMSSFMDVVNHHVTGWWNTWV